MRKRKANRVLCLLMFLIVLLSSSAWGMTASAEGETYRLTIYTDGGRWQNGSTASMVVMQPAGSVYTLPTGLVKDGYDFAGWQLIGDVGQLNGNMFTFGMGETNVHPNWTPKPIENVTLFLNAMIWLPQNCYNSDLNPESLSSKILSSMHSKKTYPCYDGMQTTLFNSDDIYSLSVVRDVVDTENGGRKSVVYGPHIVGWYSAASGTWGSTLQPYTFQKNPDVLATM